MTTTPALPEPGSATVEDRVQISRRLILQAPGELERGDRLQATEKIWGALAQMLKVHGQQRGWLNMGSHRTVGRIAQQLAAEYGNGRILNAYIAADNGHRNFYDNEMSPPEIADIITVVANVLPELESALSDPPVRSRLEMAIFGGCGRSPGSRTCRLGMRRRPASQIHTSVLQ